MSGYSVTQEKLLLIGIDGATFHVMDALLEAGRLPNLSRIMNQGCRAKLNSVIIPTSPLSWSSIVTGKNPGKHGIFHFTEKIPGQYSIRFVNASLRHGPTVWRLLSDHGKRVIVVNVPISYPPEQVLGYMVSGFDAPDEKSDYTYPPELAEDIEKWIGPYTIDLRLRSSVTRGKRAQILHDARLMEQKKAAVTCQLMRAGDWDFLMVVFNITDRIQHWFWQYMDDTHPNYNRSEAEVFGDAISESYQIIDELVGSILDVAPESSRVMVMSDHGFGPATNKAFYLNHWLAEQGFLWYRDRDRRSDRISEKLGHNARAHLVKWLPRRWKGFLKRHFPNLKSELVSYLSFSGIDWRRTKAFSSEADNFIYINMKGREREGIVDPKDYEKCRTSVAKALSLLKDPDTGEGIIDKVYRREKLYDGPFVERAPDLIFTFVDGACRLRPSQEVAGKDGHWLRPHRAENWASGNHRLEGIFAFSGPGVRSGGAELADQSVLSVAPVVLYAMGLPVPDDMDGEVILEAFDSDFRQKVELRYEHAQGWRGGGGVKPYEADEEKKIQERLRDLGYLD
jgi:predicted AlkP superfamily phosphohydrolase/phosphomutase